MLAHRRNKKQGKIKIIIVKQFRFKLWLSLLLILKSCQLLAKFQSYSLCVECVSIDLIVSTHLQLNLPIYCLFCTCNSLSLSISLKFLNSFRSFKIRNTIRNWSELSAVQFALWIRFLYRWYHSTSQCSKSKMPQVIIYMLFSNHIGLAISPHIPQRFSVNKMQLKIHSKFTSTEFSFKHYLIFYSLMKCA